MILMRPVIGPYPEPSPVTYQAYDPRAPAVAARLAALLHAWLPHTPVEHVGSTAVPGCAGKGIIDLALGFHSPRELDAINRALSAFGFQDQLSRPVQLRILSPMRLGVLMHEGDAFLVHVHVVPAKYGDLAALCAFRDRLRGDRALMQSYMTLKQMIIAAGFSNGSDYTQRKAPFVGAVLARVSCARTVA